MWGEPHAIVGKREVAKTLDDMLAINASVSMYMFHGGTSFGFSSGTKHHVHYILLPIAKKVLFLLFLGALPSNTYTPCITSYDYDAPLSEAGDPTEKYFSVREVISKVCISTLEFPASAAAESYRKLILFVLLQYLPLPDFPVPLPNPKASYGHVHLHYVANLWYVHLKKIILLSATIVANPYPLRDMLSTRLVGTALRSNYPQTFEALGQAHGYVLYCTQLHGHFPDPALLEMKGLADRAYIYIDMVSIMPFYYNEGSL